MLYIGNMDNFFFGLQGLFSSAGITLYALLKHSLVWGFALGFCASTLIHLIILVGNPRFLPQILTKGPAESFSKIASRTNDGTYQTSYSQYAHQHHRVRTGIYLALIVLFGLILLAILRY